MKICWDMLEGVCLNVEGNIVKNNNTYYIEVEACNQCKESYLTPKHRPSCFCGITCSNKNKTIISNTTRQKLSLSNKNKIVSKETRWKISAAHRGKVLSEDHKQSISISSKGRLVSNETRRRMSISQLGKKNHNFGKQPHNYKGGVKKRNIPLYDTYKNQISYAEEVRRDPERFDWMQVKCAYCGRWFLPTCTWVKDRIAVLNGKARGECRFYCSNGCKRSCPIHGMQLYPRGFKRATSREVSTYLRQMVFERDSWICQICGKTTEEIPLHCHHMDPVAQNPLFQNDANSCITLCKTCHKSVHKQYGCRYIDLRCKKEE